MPAGGTAFAPRTRSPGPTVAGRR